MSIRWPQPDFLRATARPCRPLLAWLWAACGVALLVAIGTEAVVAQRANEARAQQLARAEMRVAKARAATPVVRQALADWTALAGASAPAVATGSTGLSGAVAIAAVDPVTALRAAQRVRAQLDHPWASVLSSLEGETPTGLQWLHFDHDSASPELRVEGLSAQRDSGLELVEQLSARVGWSDVVLGRLQAPEASAPGAQWRFDIRARVDATAQFRTAP